MELVSQKMMRFLVTFPLVIFYAFEARLKLDSMVILGSCLVARKFLFQEIFVFWAFWGKKSRFLPFFNFSRQQGKNVATESCLESF